MSLADPDIKEDNGKMESYDAEIPKPGQSFHSQTHLP